MVRYLSKFLADFKRDERGAFSVFLVGMFTTLILVGGAAIDLVRSAHVEASHHLQLRPGTNVALINALSHVIVTEGLEDKDFIAARCEDDPYAIWREFIAQEAHSPEALESVTGVPAADVRMAARLYATAGNGAIYYGLGVTEHSQGSTMVLGIAIASVKIARR